VLERSHERELDRLPLLVASVWRRIAVLDAEQLVGIRLDPDGRRDALGRLVAAFPGRAVVDREDTLRPARERVERGVRRDPVEPAPQRAAAIEAAKTPPRAEERVLERVFGVVQRAEHAVAVRAQLGAVGLDQLAVCFLWRGGDHAGTETR
jgi:hypothetical protein